MVFSWQPAALCRWQHSVTGLPGPNLLLIASDPDVVEILLVNLFDLQQVFDDVVDDIIPAFCPVSDVNLIPGSAFSA